MRIGIDLDGVCHDLIGSYRRFLEGIGHDHPMPEPTEWDFCESWGLTREQFLTDLRMFANEIFNGEMLPGTLNALLDLSDAGHIIHYITHRPTGAWGVTAGWIECHNLPYPENLHFVEHKHSVPVDIHLDDHAETVVAMAEAGIPARLFNRPWNQDTTNRSHPLACRVYSWSDFLQDVKRLAQRTPSPTSTPKAPPMRTPEQHEILGTFLTLLEGPTGDGAGKRSRGEKPSWKVDPSHLGAAFRHLDPSRERYDEDSGCHKHVHAAWRLLADAYQDMVADGKIPGDPT